MAEQNGTPPRKSLLDSMLGIGSDRKEGAKSPSEASAASPATPPKRESPAGQAGTPPSTDSHRKSLLEDVLSIGSSAEEGIANALEGIGNALSHAFQPKTRDYIKLRTGARMPVIGFGTFGGPGTSAASVAAALKTAVAEHGFRHLDCAEAYANEAELGVALREVLDSGAVSRRELFVTSKVWNTNHARQHVHDSCMRTLANLQLDYLDLYLVHWPMAWRHTGSSIQPRVPTDMGGVVEHAPISMRETWEALEALHGEGLIKAIGVSNFGAQALNELLTHARIPPAVNQVECHPYLQQAELKRFCGRQRIAVSGYCPLGRPANRGGGPLLLDDPTVVEIARRLKMTAAQVLLRWGVQSGHAVLPKSASPARQAENAAALAVAELDGEAMEALGSLDRGYRFCGGPGSEIGRWNRGASPFA